MKFGTTPINDKAIFLNNIKNIANIPIITIPRLRICDLNKLCNKLLNNIKTPANLYSSLFNPNFVLRSELIFLLNHFFLNFLENL